MKDKDLSKSFTLSESKSRDNERAKDFPIAILRWSLALVFFYFSFSQMINPSAWSSFVPNFLTKSYLSANNIVMMNAILELTLGIFLAAGIYTRISSLVLSIHLFFIAFSIGFNPIGVRGFGLAMATLVVFLNGLDRYTIDWNVKNRTNGFIGILK